MENSLHVAWLGPPELSQLSHVAPWVSVTLQCQSRTLDTEVCPGKGTQWTIDRALFLGGEGWGGEVIIPPKVEEGRTYSSKETIWF